MQYYVLIILAVLISLLYGCASTIDALSNNTSGDMIRGVKLQAGVDATSGTPVPTVSFKMGSIARKGKDDKTVILIDNNTTNIVSESYDVETEYESIVLDNKKVRQILRKELRQSKPEQFGEGIFVYQKGNFNMPITSGTLFNMGGSSIISIGTVGTNTAAAVKNAK